MAKDPRRPIESLRNIARSGRQTVICIISAATVVAMILAKARHTAPTEIGDPNIDQPPRHAKSGGDLGTRPTVDDDALDYLASLSDADCAAA